MKRKEDAVSRQAVKEQMIKYGFHAPDMTVTEFVNDLPPVTPTRPKGKWIIYNIHGHDACKCSECNQDVGYEGRYDKFCKHCGADMRGKRWTS